MVQVSRPPGVTTQLLEPREEEVWGGMRLVCVMTHSGAGNRMASGHWATRMTTTTGGGSTHCRGGRRRRREKILSWFRSREILKLPCWLL